MQTGSWSHVNPMLKEGMHEPAIPIAVYEGAKFSVVPNFRLFRKKNLKHGANALDNSGGLRFPKGIL